MSDLDKDLNSLGRQWRENQRQPPPIDPSMFIVTKRRSLTVLSRLTRAVAVVAVLGVGAVAMNLATGSGRSGAQTGGEPAMTNPGDGVVATGIVVADRDGVARICDLLMVRYAIPDEERPVECSAIAVVVRGLDLSLLPGWTDRGEVGFSDPVTVRGSWTGDSIDASRAEPASVDLTDEPEVPCTTPDGGWPASPSDELDFETASTRLASALAAEPALYSGYWVTSEADGAGVKRVAVVGVVDDPDSARTILESVYPYPLCVAKVEYSSTDLERAADKIGQNLQARPLGSWRVRISQQLDRVSVRTPVVDADIVQLLDNYPEAIADPLVGLDPVRPADAP